MPAAKSWRHKTTRPDEIWQCDATNLFITGWGYYKLIPVQDDYSRKIERFNRSIKGKLCLVVYCSPEELKKATDEAIAVYNATPHESLQNVYPNDVYAGRGGNIRKTKGEETLDFRKTEAVQS
ncbi:MAG: hypothetical protein HQ594_02095 [Candidatus Omnitrophica bacterium]|nr:hypothetical protein [Candidatus Omnitrophota bacterium]